MDERQQHLRVLINTSLALISMGYLNSLQKSLVEKAIEAFRTKGPVGSTQNWVNYKID
jgi:hypothetical protein